jgi:curved DNA-binding protein CbpA
MRARQPSRDEIVNALHDLGLHLPTTVSDVARAHRDLSKLFHPDRFRVQARKAYGTEKMKSINGARSLLMAHLDDFLATDARRWTKHHCIKCSAAYADLWPLDPRD